MTYYRDALARIHHEGFGFHADDCAPGILAALAPVRERNGLVIELGCGSGLLTRHLVNAGHRVIATDASPAMLALAREYAPGVVAVASLALPADPIPSADAIVSVGHMLSYLPDEAAIHRSVVGVAEALRPGGVGLLDVCDLSYAEARQDPRPKAWVTDDWALFTEFSVPAPDRFVRQMACFVRDAGGGWTRDDERHENVLIDAAALPALLANHGVRAEIRLSFGSELLPSGLVVLAVHRPNE